MHGDHGAYPLHVEWERREIGPTTPRPTIMSNASVASV